MGHLIRIATLVGLCLSARPGVCQDAPVDEKVPEGELRRYLPDPPDTRAGFPRDDALKVTPVPSTPLPAPYDRNRPAEKMLLKDLDPRKSYYGNGVPVFSRPADRRSIGGDGIGGLPLDQLTREIVRFKSQGDPPRPVTVVWLFDETRSMQDDRAAMSQKLRRCVGELDEWQTARTRAWEELGLSADDVKNETEISHFLAGFGESLSFRTFQPLRDLAGVQETFNHLDVDESGIENTFHAVRTAIAEARRTVPEGNRLLLVVFTDESGNDDEFVEDALQTAEQHKVPVYVVGRQSLFGMTRLRLGAPRALADESRQPTIRRGPESAEIEALAWDGLQPRDDEQPSGFAPYGLARLAKHTGGIYFMLPTEELQRAEQREKAYSIVSIKEYVPDYGPRNLYLAQRDRSPLRRAIYDAIQATRDFSLPLRFSNEPRPLAELAQDAAAKAARQRGELITIEGKLRALRDERAAEPSARWQAHYDLMLAQIVAYQVTLREYQSAVLELRPTPAPPHTVWDVAHGRARHAPNHVTDPGYSEAEALLQLVIKQHPKTPWADLAQTIRNRGLSVEFTQSRPFDAILPLGAATNY